VSPAAFYPIRQTISKLVYERVETRSLRAAYSALGLNNRRLHWCPEFKVGPSPKSEVRRAVPPVREIRWQVLPPYSGWNGKAFEPTKLWGKLCLPIESGRNSRTAGTACPTEPAHGTGHELDETPGLGQDAGTRDWDTGLGHGTGTRDWDTGLGHAAPSWSVRGLQMPI